VIQFPNVQYGRAGFDHAVAGFFAVVTVSGVLAAVFARGGAATLWGRFDPSENVLLASGVALSGGDTQAAVQVELTAYSFFCGCFEK